MRKFILGTDWWTDCDDAMAVRLLANAVLSKKAELLGVGINACMEYSTASLNRFLDDSGITGVPIGIDREATDFGGKPRYQERLALRSGNKPDNSSAEDAVQMYIRLLGESPEKVEILEIGYPQVLAGVMKAEPKLFAEKVSKIWMMAGTPEKKITSRVTPVRHKPEIISARTPLFPLHFSVLRWARPS